MQRTVEVPADHGFPPGTRDGLGLFWAPLSCGGGYWGAQRGRIRVHGVACHDCGRREHRHGLIAQPARRRKQRRAAEGSGPRLRRVGKPWAVSRRPAGPGAARFEAAGTRSGTAVVGGRP